MSCRIKTWYPKSVYIANDVRTDLLNPLSEKIKSLSESEGTIKTASLHVESSHIINRKIHLQEELFKDLSEEIMMHVARYASALGYCDAFIDRCQMADMWYNISDKGDFIFPHSHPGAFFSGAYYVKAMPGNEIKFYGKLDHYVEVPQNPNQISCSIATFDCIPGELLVFQSDLVHGVPAQQVEGEKIVVSFNVVNLNKLKGESYD